MRPLLALMLCFLLACTITAQEESPTPYETALQRIEEARLTNSSELYLADLDLSELPPEIGSLSNLVVLILSENRLTSLPPEITSLQNLRQLTLSDNQFSDFPAEILALTNLERLYLWGNQLSALPAEIGNLANLQDLSVPYNYLTELPVEIGLLENLRRLQLRSNRLTTLPRELGNLHKLCFLDIGQNDLRELPYELSKLSLLLNERDCNNSSSYGLELDNNPLVSPPLEVVEQGTPAILAYLRNEAWWHLQRLILGGTGFVSIVIIGILAFRWRNHRRKEKRKNAEVLA